MTNLTEAATINLETLRATLDQLDRLNTSATSTAAMRHVDRYMDRVDTLRNRLRREVPHINSMTSADILRLLAA